MSHSIPFGFDAISLFFVNSFVVGLTGLNVVVEGCAVVGSAVVGFAVAVVVFAVVGFGVDGTGHPFAFFFCTPLRSSQDIQSLYSSKYLKNK